MDIACTFVNARDRDVGATSHGNDSKELNFLEQAIAYANVVVTENQPRGSGARP